ncbi:MAG TPA: GMC family oxidoreductase [Polyangiaceae bacterium]|nr:GMC family oxidoreductase [Polyangiaceae bacterium]
MPDVRYDVTALDHRRFVRGVKLLARMHFEMGADEVWLPFDLDGAEVVHSADELERFTTENVPKSALELFTVHLMGTARMGADRRSSVTSPSGELWDLPGCYVADASLFPTAIGVNPQISIMALATRVAFRLELARRAA